MTDLQEFKILRLAVRGSAGTLGIPGKG